ncbi:MAG TPA: hypothetical protein V6D18_16565, partial [Thermosynechococcaceae cyanobacterium]
YAVITSGRSRSTATAQAEAEAETEQEGISLEEKQRLAGMDEETQSLISPEDRLDPEAVPVKRDLSRSPIPRTVFVLGFVGVFVVFGFLITLIAGLGRGRAPQVAQSPRPTNDVIDPTKADEYKGKLALTEQQRDQQQRNNAGTTTPSSPKPQPTPTASPRTGSTTRTAANSTATASRTPPPTPRPVQPVQPVQPALPPVRTAAPATPPARTEDPLAQWNRLAALGSAKAEVDKQTQEAENPTGATAATVPGTAMIPVQGGYANGDRTNSPTSVTTQNGQRAGAFTSEVIGDGSMFPSSSARTVANSSSPVLVASSTGFGIAAEATMSPETMSPGTRGILDQRNESEEIAGRNQQITLGTSAAAEVAVPMYWEPSGNNGGNGRFAVTLKEPLLSTTGEVSLPVGTVFITEATGVNDESRIVNQTVVAVVYQAVNGEVRQEPVQPGTILIRGRNNQPLIAEMSRQRGNFGDDLKIGLFGAIGRAGELLNQGDVFSSSSNSEGLNSSSSTIINRRSNRTNILAAALDGFFNPLQQRLEQRAEQRQEENSRSTPILVVEQGETVSIFVNGILEVSP